MPSFTWSVFDRGPTARILDLAVMCQESGGRYSLTDELAAFVRLVQSSNEAQWLCPVTTVTALLDLTAEYLERKQAELPQEFTAKLARAAGGTGGAEYLRALAGILRAIEQDTAGETAPSAGAGWDTDIRFRMLRGFYDNWIGSGEYESLEEAISAAIDSEHPFCGDFLAPVASEAESALVRLLDSADSGAGLSHTMSWATAATLTTLLDAVNGHMRHEHPDPLATPDHDHR
ncbi:hypothetical protein [Streptomyces broussonetiae]|uniref:CdiI immunity protein domain-containing protein n=1 Tax=Streptomyces broussonetiae TaxID=2686304 RepID=A0A6I6N5A3_9ACTN|nr:hypothetical protein [Streptomyces broussonetiae]QHA05819.1 hypothetical protein GQF42_23275 [Streptomyces broussonetiae]